MSSDPPAPLRVGVFPLEGMDARSNLFGALEGAFPVTFEGRSEGGTRDLDAAIELPERSGPGAGDGVPTLALLVPESGPGTAPAAFQLGAVGVLAPALRGAELTDPYLPPALEGDAAEIDVGAGATVLAEHQRRPVWVRTGERATAVLAPAELGNDEALRERLCLDRCAGLLPIVHFLRALTEGTRWQPPPARASVIFDDPNLHRTTYGYLDLREVGRDARERGYHVSLATVPLDSRFASRAAIRAVNESAGAISLVTHGNDHYGPELGRPADERTALALAAQAARRVRAFEARAGIPIERVMVPPHEECSRAMISALARCGFEAVTMTRPYPWLATPPRSWLARPETAGALTGWSAADLVEGTPVYLRHPLLTRDPPEIVLRAFLGHPVVLYGHHDDLREGIEVLRAGVADVERTGPVDWLSPGQIAATNFETRVDGTTLAVRPLGRRLEVEIPEGVDGLVLAEPPAGLTDAHARVDGADAGFDETVPVAPGGKVEVELTSPNRVDVDSVPAPRPQPAAWARRLGGEARDRLLPLARGRRQ